LRDIPVLASADDFPFVAWSQWPDTLPAQIRPKASVIFVVSLWRKSFRLFVILAWIGCTRRFLPALGGREGGLVAGEHSRILSLDARKRHAFLEAEIYTNLSVLCVRFRLVLNRKIAIPTSASVPGKRSGFDPSLNFPGVSKDEFCIRLTARSPLRS
jgi:hypothetical protein